MLLGTACCTIQLPGAASKYMQNVSAELSRIGPLEQSWGRLGNSIMMLHIEASWESLGAPFGASQGLLEGPPGGLSL